MKNGWKYLDFEDCIESVTYTPKVLRKNFLGEGEFPIVSQEQDFVNGYWNNPNDVFKIKKPVVIFGDHTQVVKYIDFDFVLGADGVKIFQPIDEIFPRYFYYFLTSVELRSLGYARHYRLLKEVSVPVPPIEEQRRIVAILDAAFACIDKAKANTEKNIQNARELFDSYLNNIFSNPGPDWGEKGFDELCEISSMLVDPRLSEYQDLTHVGAANIETKTGELSDLKTAREEKLISGKFWFDQSMVLYSKIRPYLMKVARPDFDGLCSADIYPLASKNGAIDRDFLFYLLLSPDFTDYAIAGSARAGMPKVNREHLFAYRCNLPPMKVQKDISKKFDEISFRSRALENKFDEKIAELDELKKSILQKAFSGEL